MQYYSVLVWCILCMPSCYLETGVQKREMIWKFLVVHFSFEEAVVKFNINLFGRIVFCMNLYIKKPPPLNWQVQAVMIIALILRTRGEVTDGAP